MSSAEKYCSFTVSTYIVDHWSTVLKKKLVSPIFVEGV